jgi:hypothetical protein
MRVPYTTHPSLSTCTLILRSVVTDVDLLAAAMQLHHLTSQADEPLDMVAAQEAIAQQYER